MSKLVERLRARLRSTSRVDLAAAAFVIAAFVALALVATRLFHAFPHSADEWDCLFQARLLEHLHLKSPPLPTWTRPTGLRWFPPHIISGAEGVFGKYPPGWPLLLAIGSALGVPALVNPLLGALLLAVTYVLVRRVAGAKSALLAIALMGTSSFFVVNASSFYAHVLVALVTMTIALALHRYWSSDEPKTRHVVIAALALGFLALTRPFDAALLAPALVVAAVAIRRKFGRRSARDGVRVALLVGLGAAAVLAYNLVTTGKAFVFGHQAYLADPDLAKQFRPPSSSVLAQAFIEYGQVAVPIWIAILAAVWLLARPRDLSRGVLVVALLVAVAPWVGYAFRPPPTAIHYGPRYELTTLPIAAALIGIALARIPSLPVLVLAAIVPLAWQLTVTARHARDLSITLYRGKSIERAATELGRAIAPERAVVVATGPAGSLPAIDLVRNQDVDGQVLVGAGFLRNRVDRAAHRKTYVWDGLPGLPMLWSVAAADDIQQIIVTEPVTVIHRREDAAGWLVTWNRTSCGAADSRRRGGDVSVPGTRPENDSAFGPCSGEPSGVATSSDGTFRTSSPGPAAVQLRAFVVADKPGSYIIEGKSNGVLAARQIIIGDHDRLVLNGDVPATPGSVSMHVTGEGVATFVGFAAYGGDGPGEDLHLTISLPPGLRAYSRVLP